MFEEFALFLMPLAVGLPYVIKIKEVPLKLAFSYLFGVFVPSSIYFIVWLVAGLKFELFYWALINLFVLIFGVVWWVYEAKKARGN